MEYTTKTILCNHCGNEGIMKIHGKYVNELTGDYVYHDENIFLECPVCHKPVLYNSFISEDDFDINDEGNQIPYTKVIFPSKNLHNSIPNKIKDAYESALKTKNTDLNIFALALRRTLELITTDKNAQGNSLQDKISFLSSNGVLPEQLKQAANLTRLIGNLGAHSTIEDNISETDLVKLSDFIGFIIQYLYVLPSEIDLLNKKLQKN